MPSPAKSADRWSGADSASGGPAEIGRPGLGCVSTAPTTAAMERLGECLAGLLAAGDLVILSGPLGAGKTVLARGVGAGLEVQGPVISPTFVLARVHPSLVGGPGLVHVDAYRLSSPAEIDDLDLDSSLADSVTLVEWGEGLAEQLSGDRLEVVVERADDPLDDTRRVWLRPVGRRWTEVDWPAWAEATARAEVAQAAAEPTTGGGRDMAESAAGGGRAAAGESEADHG